MKSNISKSEVLTHEGGKGQRVSSLLELRRSVLACFLFEDSYYESGSAAAKRIANLVAVVEPQAVADLAIEAREKMHLRHVPLFLLRELSRRKGCGPMIRKALWSVIQRADEMGELCAMYFGPSGDRKTLGQKLPASVKRGLAECFTKFNAYQLAKYNRGNVLVKLKDVFWLVTPTTTNKERYATWGQLLKDELPAPDTWEVALSAAGPKGDKNAIWTRLILDNKLGGLALLRNLRNMKEAGLDNALIESALRQGNFDKVLPFRFVAAASFAPQLESMLEVCMFRAVESLLVLKGRTCLLVDVSGSMSGRMSAKSDLSRLDGASALAMLLREKAEAVDVFTFSNHLAEVPSRRGFALKDAILKSQPHSATYLAKALKELAAQNTKYDRLIVFTDEQSQDGVTVAGPRAYCINVAGYKTGLTYGNGWTHIDGFSERTLDFIQASEQEG